MNSIIHWPNGMTVREREREREKYRTNQSSQAIATLQNQIVSKWKKKTNNNNNFQKYENFFCLFKSEMVKCKMCSGMFNVQCAMCAMCTFMWTVKSEQEWASAHWTLSYASVYYSLCSFANVSFWMVTNDENIATYTQFFGYFGWFLVHSSYRNRLNL